jgi:hypothetical protein
MTTVIMPHAGLILIEEHVDAMHAGFVGLCGVPVEILRTGTVTPMVDQRAVQLVQPDPHVVL